jgi:NADPH:quinone reductase-like Zn-dependent oxidoreductase
MDAHEGVPALMCQEMARRGVIVTTVIPDDIKAKVLAHGASGGLVGSPAAALMSLDEAMVHLVVDTRGGTKVTQAAKRALVDGGHLLTLIRDGNASSPTSTLSFRNAFKRRVGDAVVLAGTGEPNVDSSGLDCRDVLEEPAMEYLVPVVGRVVPFERGAELFVAPREPGTVGGVVRIIN